MRYSRKRQDRLRRLIRSHNKIRKKQAKQIDILCHDLIDAQRIFITKLGTIGFSAGFYRALVGVTDLDKLLKIASDQVRELMPDMQVSFYLKQSTKACKEIPYTSYPADQPDRLESFIDEVLIQAIYDTNKVCRLPDLQAMGLPHAADQFNDLKVVTIPLTVACESIGFVLLHTQSLSPLKNVYLEQLCVCSGGLAQAVVATERYSRSL